MALQQVKLEKLDRLLAELGRVEELQGAALLTQQAKLDKTRTERSRALVERADVEAAIAEARAFAQKPGAVTRILNDKYRLDEVPRIFVDWIEFEGPIEPEWPPKSHVALFPRGMNDDAASVRDSAAPGVP